MRERSAAAHHRRHATAAHAAPVHVLQFRPWQAGRDHGDAAKLPGISVEGRECGPIVGAVCAAVNDDGAIDS